MLRKNEILAKISGREKTTLDNMNYVLMHFFHFYFILFYFTAFINHLFVSDLNQHMHRWFSFVCFLQTFCILLLLHSMFVAQQMYYIV